MKESCLRAQEAISRAADGDRVEVNEAAWAKRHCAECSTCTAYVRTLAAMKSTASARAPEAAVNRTVNAVLALAEADRAAAVEAARLAEKRAAEATTMPDADAAAESATADVTPIDGPRMSVGALAAWIAGSAAVLVGAMVVTAIGLQFISGQKGSVNDAPVAQRSADTMSEQEAFSAEDDGTMASGTAPLGTPRYVMVDGYAYVFIGTMDVNAQSMPVFGSTRSALDTDGIPRQRDVYSDNDGDTIYIEEGGLTMRFNLVFREFDGTVYALRADDIDSFGEWPSLPDLIPEPATADGEPVFVESGDDDGEPIYTLPGKKPTDGFAVSPNTSVNDPAAGNPQWTWWEQQP